MVSLCSSAVHLGNLHILHADSRQGGGKTDGYRSGRGVRNGGAGTIACYNVNIEMYLAAALKFSAKSKQDRWLFRRRQLGAAGEECRGGVVGGHVPRSICELLVYGRDLHFKAIAMPGQAP